MRRNKEPAETREDEGKSLTGKKRRSKPATQSSETESDSLIGLGKAIFRAATRRGKKAEAPTADSNESRVEAPARPSHPKKRDESAEADGPPDLRAPKFREAAKEKPARARAVEGSATQLGEGIDEPDLPIPIWRAATRAPSGRAGHREKKESEPQRTYSDRKPRRRGESVEPVIDLRPKTPAPIAPPPKPLIPIPEGAPRVIVVNGAPTLVRAGRAYPPMAFFGSSPDERRAETVLEEIRLAAQSGVHIHIHLVEFEVDRNSVDASVSFAAYMLAKTIEADPEAQVIFRVVFAAPANWEDLYPEARYADQSGRVAEPSVCDDQFWAVAREALSEFVRRIRMLEEREHILGIHLDRGEWFYAKGAGYDTSKAAVKAFQNWAKTRYLNDPVALRAAWFNGEAEFETLDIPPYREPQESGGKFMRVSRNERPWVDYHLFLSDAAVYRIADLAYAVKLASEGNLLVGVSYGYTFEWSHPSSGHLSLGKLLRTPEIDFIGGPPSYQGREPGGAAPFPSPIDSFSLNGKLYISEEDFKTAIGDYREPDDFNPVIKTPQALESVHWRGIGAALAHGSGVAWMDLWGNGWLKTATIWHRAARARETLIRRLAAPFTAPDVAVFIDERALAYLVDQHSFALLVQNVRESALRSGLSSGFYLLSDLAHREWFPDSKLSIFLNAWDMRPEHRAAIKSRMQKDGKLLFWLYCAGLFDAGRESLERAREVTGIALKPQPFHSKTGTTILNRRHPLCEVFPDKGLIGGHPLDPSYFAIPEEATVLGEYSQTGLPSFVIKEIKEETDPDRTWTSVFMGEPVVTPALVRVLGQLAGAHVWNYHDDVVHVRPPFLTVHCTGPGPRTITLPTNWVGYDVMSREWCPTDSANIRFNALDGSTHLFLVGLRYEIEALLKENPDDLLKITEMPAPEQHAERIDPAALDVPIMKLDDWIGGVPEDVSDEWFLRPQLFEQPPEAEPQAGESEEPPGRRRRRKPRPDDRRGRREQPDMAFDEIGMSVKFRKRD